MTKHIPYFRFYPADFMSGVRGMTAQEVGLYIMLLARIYEESGPIEDHALKLSTYCGMRQATFERTLAKLVDLGKIQRSNGVLFNERAGVEISNRANDLKIASKAGTASAEKRQQNQRQDATPVQRPFNHTDTDTDTDTEEREVLAASPQKQKAVRRVNSSLPEEWVPSDRNISDAIQRNFTMQEIDNEADKFRNHHLANGTIFKDWDAAWRTWLGNARKFAGSSGMAGKASARGYGQGGSIASIAARRRLEGQV